ncbi:MAG: hypothetical protein JO112_01050 [Planctomycetes bacterium]|nr:hypothetical protein [Planctomycetota bacterium]
MSTQKEQALAQQLFGNQEQQSKGALSAVKEAVLAVAPGLKDFVPEVKAELTQQFAHGAHELAAALFSGSGFVMYPRGSGKDDHGVHGPEQGPDHGLGTQAMEAPAQQMERGGRSM